MEHRIEAVLNKLDSLSRRDRRWVLERLPESAKAALMGDRDRAIHPGSDSMAAVRNEVAPLKSTDSLGEFSSGSVARVLANEPAWIVEALLREGDALWRKQVLSQLPYSVRSSVISLSHVPLRISKPVLVSLQCSVRRKLEVVDEESPSADNRPQWKRWLALHLSLIKVRA